MKQRVFKKHEFIFWKKIVTTGTGYFCTFNSSKERNEFCHEVAKQITKINYEFERNG